MRTNQKGFTILEVLMSFGLLTGLMLSLGSLTNFIMRSTQSARTSLDLSALTARIDNIVLNDSLCSVALAGQSMAAPLPKNVSLYRSPGNVEFAAGINFNSLRIQSVTLTTLDGAAPVSTRDVYPSRLTLTASPLEPSLSSLTYTITAMLNVTTNPSGFSIVKCTKVKFSDQSFAAPPCPASAPVAGCTNPAVPQMLTVAADGVTPICVTDWTQCCAAGSHPVQVAGSDPRSTPGAVYCRANYCNTQGSGPYPGWDTYAKGICCSNGLSGYGPYPPPSCP